MNNEELSKKISKLPNIIKEVGFDFSWDEYKIWELDVPVEQMPIDKLTWHFDIPFIWSKPGGYYDIKPCEVIKNPNQHKEEYERTMTSNTAYPIDIMFWKERWLILDGLHRLMKQAIEGKTIVQVRKIPKRDIPNILKNR